MDIHLLHRLGVQRVVIADNLLICPRFRFAVTLRGAIHFCIGNAKLAFPHWHVADDLVRPHVGCWLTPVLAVSNLDYERGIVADHAPGVNGSKCPPQLRSLAELAQLFFEWRIHLVFGRWLTFN